MKKKTVTKLKWLIAVVVILGLIFAALSGISYIRLYRAYAALEKDNRPMKPEEIIPPAIVDTENAALLYQSAILRLKAEVRDDESLLDYMQSLSDKIIKDPNAALYTEMEALLDMDLIKYALDCIEQGVERPGCCFEVDYENMLDFRMDNPAELRALAKLLAAKARYEARQGKSDQAWHSVEILFRYADAMRDEPVLIFQLMRIAKVNIAAETVYHVAGKVPLNEQQKEIFNNVLIDLEDNEPMTAAFDGERILLGEWLFNSMSRKYFRSQLGEYPSGVFSPQLLARLYAWCKPVLNSDHSTYLTTMHYFTKSAQQPYYNLDLDRNGEQIVMDLPRYMLVSRSLIPAGLKVHRSHSRMVANLRITYTGLAILQYQKTHGSFPESLDDLAMSPPPDPFTGKPLIYRRENAGFLLYSIGWDLQDDGGIPQQRKVKMWDIVWRYADADANP